MKKLVRATAGVLFLATAALALGGWGHYRHGYCGAGPSHGTYTAADHRHDPGCGHPYTR
jgi:hypothetical protein